MVKVLAGFVHRSILTVSVLALLGTGWTAPVLAKPVFNQSPETVDRALGRYWTKLTKRDEEGLFVTYTYSPAKLRRLLPDYKVTQLFLIYRDNQAKSVHMVLSDKSGEPLVTDREKIVSEQLEAKFFEAIFGYRAPTYKPLLEVTGVWPVYRDCLGDGVMAEYGQSAHSQILEGMTLLYEPRCVRPYDKIKLQVEKGPSGG